MIINRIDEGDQMRKTILTVFVLLFFVVGSGLFAQYNPGEGFNLAWSLDPTGDPNFDTRDGYGARSVQVGMDFDRDGHREIMFTMDEALAPGGPDPGLVDVYLYEATGNDTYEHVWHYTSPDLGNSLPGLAYGDIDEDGLYEIYLGVAPAVGSNDDTWGTHIFEQDTSGVFPATPTLIFQYGLTVNDNFRAAGFVLDDVDGDGDIELVTVDRGTRKMTVHSLVGTDFNEFAAFTQEFIDTENLGGGGVYDVDVVDFDGDGFKEIWVNTWDMFSMAVFEASGADTYSLQVDLNQIFGSANDPGSINSQEMMFKDIDGDGAMEAWFPMTDGVLYYLDNVDSSVADLTGSDFVSVGRFSAGESRGAGMGDIDDDGHPDIVCSNGTEERITRIEYLGMGDPADSTSYEWTEIFNSVGGSADRYYPPRIAPVDLDGDGNKEVVLTNIKATDVGAPAIIVLEYNPETASPFANGWSMLAALNHHDSPDSTFYGDISGTPRSVIGGMDMDQDGAAEVIATSYTGRRVHVFEYNATATAFEQVWSSPIDTASQWGSSPRIVDVGDLDGDGKQEIVFPRSTAGLEGWWLFEWDGVVGSDNYGTTYSSINMVEVDTCCPGAGSAFRGDHERITIADVDGDGTEEMVIMIRRNSGGDRGTLITSVVGDIEHNAGGNGFETWVSEYFLERGSYGGGSPYDSQPADLDGDGHLELVNHTWNYFNFYNISSTGTDTYVAASPDSASNHYQTTYPNDHVALFGGGVGDIDGDGNDEAYFPNYYTRDLYVVDYNPGDNVLEIDGTHVVKIAENVGNFYASVFDVDGNDHMEVYTGQRYGQAVVSTEFVGTDPRSSASYNSSVIYTGENDLFYSTTIVDSGGVVTTTRTHDVPGDAWFASKIQSNFNGEAIDFDGDGKNELIVSFQGMSDSLVTNNYTWNGTSWDTVVTTVFNERGWAFVVIENEEMGVGIDPITFITPNNYVLRQNYPNPFNPTTTIEYEIPIDKNISIKVYNMMGQLVTTLVDNQYQTAGNHRVMWNGLNSSGIRVATGAYIYSLEWGNYRKTHKMLLLK